jgi:CHAT domain-containing protein
MRGLRFQPLPGAEQEGRLIDEQVKKANLPQVLYTKIDAEEEVLAALEVPPRVLHVATHGFFLKPNDELRRRLLAMQRGAEVTVPPPGDNPMLRAGLAFAGINSNAPYLGEIDTRNDGVLTALEVLGLNLAGTELAVLSACETGLGEIHYGEGVYGLRRAFQEAGVQEIVMSLWEVSDAGTQALMTEMYERLLAGATPREALRGAQRELATSAEWGYPYIWAAFTVAGR